MKNIFLFLISFTQLSFSFVAYAENIRELTAKAIKEANPAICQQAKEFCYENDWEKSCVSKIDNSFMCLRDYAIAKSKPNTCDQIQGEESGRLMKNKCYEQYARNKKDLKSCEILHNSFTPDQILYESCVYSIQRDIQEFTLQDCLRIKSSKRSYFIARLSGYKLNNCNWLSFSDLSSMNSVSVSG